MISFLRNLWLAVRRVPAYAALLLLALSGFAWLGWQGRSAWGDDNESTEAVDGPGSRSHGHSGHVRYYHK